MQSIAQAVQKQPANPTKDSPTAPQDQGLSEKETKLQDNKMYCLHQGDIVLSKTWTNAHSNSGGHQRQLRINNFRGFHFA